ncbi:hypothetical protein POM88_016130 [Heracleum sosnowskyi]|uniref:Bifunctional inhibitor/plant lipid transfer protein/seed storage helical domain-containing protein n=1 Tax=Heracleum sosnowskyi TaxID=360622 RepID=A0AAD8ILF4_9APIA|nr:hypothetical protein POM88_016130 [Heracleum sosnowskyi]
MRVSYPAMFFVFVLLLTAGSVLAGNCNPAMLSPCLNAFVGPSQPSKSCCTRLHQQKSCLCQYVRDPAYQNDLHTYHGLLHGVIGFKATKKKQNRVPRYKLFHH